MHSNYKFGILLLGLILTSALAPAQQVLKASDRYPEHRYSKLTGKVNPIAYHRVKGDPYLYTGSIQGEVQLLDGTRVSDAKIMFDICAHQLLVYNDYHSRIVAVSENIVQAFSIEYLGAICHFQHFQLTSPGFHGRDHVYLQVLSSGENTFLKYYYKEKVQLTTADPLYSDEFKSGIRYYCTFNDKFERIRFKESFFKKKFPEQYPQIKDFISQNKVKVKNEDGFTRVMDFLNDLNAAQ